MHWIGGLAGVTHRRHVMAVKRNALRLFIVAALLVGVAAGCRRKKGGGGYFGPTPIPSAASQVR